MKATPARLLLWSLATFHTAFFFAAFVAALYLNGSIADLLASLNTLVGTAVYLLLWATTWWTTRQAWRALKWERLDDPLDVTALLGMGTLYGGINGMLFLSVIALVAIPVGLAAIIVEAIRLGRLEDMAGLVAAGFFSLIVLAIAEVVAFGIGALVGLLFAIVDGVLLHIAWWLAALYQAPPPTLPCFAGEEFQSPPPKAGEL